MNNDYSKDPGKFGTGLSATNDSIVKEYLKHPQLLDYLKDWITRPDANLRHRLLQASVVVNKIQPLTSPMTVFRGFRLSGISSQNLDFDTNSEYGEKKVLVISDPVSFSTEFNIAKKYGNGGIVRTIINPEDSYVNFTDELIVAINMSTNSNFEKSLKEIVILPNGSAKEFELVSDKVYDT